MKRIIFLLFCVLSASIIRGEESVKFNKCSWTEENGEMNIHLDIEISGCKDQSLQVSAYFYTADGTKVKDTNGRYRASDGQVATHVDIKPRYDNSHWEDLILSIPVSELHPLPGENSYYINLQVFKGKNSIGDTSKASTYKLTGTTATNQSANKSQEQKNILIKYISSQIEDNKAASLLYSQSELSAAIQNLKNAKFVKFYPLATYGFFSGGICFYNSTEKMIDYTDDILSVFGEKVAVFQGYDTNQNRKYVYVKKGVPNPYTTVYVLEKKQDGHLDLIENLYNGGTQITSTRYTDDYNFQQEYYKDNAQFASPGISFTDDSSSSSSSSSSTGKSNSNRSSKSNCPYCHGTGVIMSQSSGGNMSDHVAYYNSAGEICPYCGYTNKHFHTKCLH